MERHLDEYLRTVIRHYNHKKYWKMRELVIDCDRHCFIRKLWYLVRIKRMDSFNCASMGTHLNYGAHFTEPPKLPHGLLGIIISHNAKIGKNCTIYHQVTIGNGRGGSTEYWR